MPVHESCFFRDIGNFQIFVFHQLGNLLHSCRDDESIEAQAFFFFENGAKIAERNIELVRDIGGGQVDIRQVCFNKCFDAFYGLDRISLADRFDVIADDLQVFREMVEQSLFAAEIFHLQNVIGKTYVKEFCRIVCFVREIIQNSQKSCGFVLSGGERAVLKRFGVSGILHDLIMIAV